MTTHGLTPCAEMVKGFWASPSHTPAFPFQKERAESATRLQLTTIPRESFKIYFKYLKFFGNRFQPSFRDAPRRGVAPWRTRSFTWGPVEFHPSFGFHSRHSPCRTLHRLLLCRPIK